MTTSSLKKKNVIIAVVFSVVMLVTGFIYNSNITYAVNLNGQKVGIVKEKGDIKNILDDYIKELEKEKGIDIKIKGQLSYNNSFDKSITPSDKLKKNLIENIELVSDGYCITVDGSEVVYLKDKNEAKVLLDRVKSDYINEDRDYEILNIEFVEEVKIEKKETEIDKIMNIEDAYNYLKTENIEIINYTVKNTDTIGSIIARNSLKVSDLKLHNPKLDIKKGVKDGETLKIPRKSSFVDVKMTTKINYNEKVPYETEYKKSNNMYENESRVEKSGKSGEKNVNSEIIFINGKFVSEKILSEKIVSQPTNKIVVKGIKERPKTLAYGKFYNPMSRGRFTSGFGPRWGRMHKGIDLAASTGTPITAADGGKVVHSGWDGAYGKLVIIDHENGYKTYYAHCSKLLVSSGERVARGQLIAKSGSTGRVTGPHLHFEVRKNNIPVNPSNYIN